LKISNYRKGRWRINTSSWHEELITVTTNIVFVNTPEQRKKS
jgi:hypothetical protein